MSAQTDGAWSAGPTTAAREATGGRGRHSRRARRSRVRWALAALGVGLALLSLDGAWAAWTAARGLGSSRNALERGARALTVGNTSEATAAFAEAADGARSARSAARRPAVRLLGALPWLDGHVDAVRALAEATELAARAGRDLAGAAEVAGWDGEAVSGLADGLAARLDGIEAATPAIDRAAALLDRATAEVRAVRTPGLLGPVREAVVEARAELEDGARLARRAALGARLLPGLLGAEGPRRYALVMMNLSDARGSGGYPGSYAVVTADEGRIELTELAPTSTLGSVPAIEPPREDVRRYARFGALTHFISTTYPPDWPTSAELWLRMWEASGREPLDGVIGADAVWMSYLLEATGPVDVPEWPETITAENVVRVMGQDTFLTTDPEESDAWQAGIGTALWEAALTRAMPPEAFASALGRATAERHLQVYVPDAEDEALLGELDAAGDVDLGEDDVLVTWSGITANRAGAFAQTSIGYSPEAAEDGSARVELTITVSNVAPDGPESILLGLKGDGYAPGTYAALANVYLPVGATDVESEVDGGPGLQLIEEELGHPVVLQAIEVEPGGSSTVVVGYVLPAARAGAALEGSVSLTPPVAVEPVQVTVTTG